MLVLILGDEKYNTQKNPRVVFATQKNPGVFHRPQKNSLLAKMSDPKKSVGPPVIKICEWGPWGSTTIGICSYSLGSLHGYKKQ